MPLSFLLHSIAVAHITSVQVSVPIELTQCIFAQSGSRMTQKFQAAMTEQNCFGSKKNFSVLQTYDKTKIKILPGHRTNSISGYLQNSGMLTVPHRIVCVPGIQRFSRNRTGSQVLGRSVLLHSFNVHDRMLRARLVFSLGSFSTRSPTPFHAFSARICGAFRLSTKWREY